MKKKKKTFENLEKGQELKVVKHHGGFEAGDIVTICELDKQPGTYYPLRACDEKGLRQWVSLDEVEVIEPDLEVGDVVKLIEKATNHFGKYEKGMVGRVINVETYILGSDDITVEFPEKESVIILSSKKLKKLDVPFGPGDKVRATEKSIWSGVKEVYRMHPKFSEQTDSPWFNQKRGFTFLDDEGEEHWGAIYKFKPVKDDAGEKDDNDNNLYRVIKDELNNFEPGDIVEDLEPDVDIPCCKRITDGEKHALVRAFEMEPVKNSEEENDNNNTEGEETQMLNKGDKVIINERTSFKTFPESQGEIATVVDPDYNGMITIRCKGNEDVVYEEELKKVKEGQRFEVIDNTSYKKYGLQKGDTAVLVKDDGSSYPFFKVLNPAFHAPREKVAMCYSRLKAVEDKEEENNTGEDLKTKEKGERKIIAVDFDGVLVTDEYPAIGAPNRDVIVKLWKEVRDGAFVILWTCRSGQKLAEAEAWMDKFNVPYHRVNANAPWVLEEWVRDNRKIYADEYWDDKAVPVEELKDNKEPLTIDDIEVGMKVRIIGNNNHHDFPLGETVRVKEVNPLRHRPNFVAEYLDGRDFWYVLPKDVEIV